MYNEFSAVVVFQMLIMGGLVAIQSGEFRKIIAFIFVVPTLLHNALFTQIYLSDSELAFHINNTPYIYHYSAGLISLLVAYMFSRINQSSKLMGDLQFIAVVSISLNAIGWLLYKNNIENELIINNLLFTALYGFAIYALLAGEPKHEGRDRSDTRLFVIRPRYLARNTLHTN